MVTHNAPLRTTGIKNTLLPVQTTLRSRGRLLDLRRPVVMGILNATPDSFYTRGQGSDMSSLVDLAGSMLEAGAALLDVGGASSRPGSAVISPAEETDRVLPVIEAIKKHHASVWMSVDTYHASVARAAAEAGALIVNDISAGNADTAMLEAVADLQVPYIAMHMQGTPQTMQDDPQYGDVAETVRLFLAGACARCREAGITDVIVDPGFGFGKTVAHNFSLLNRMHTLRILGKPVLAGISRKSMICRPLQVQPSGGLNGTTALHMVALQQGASILRVHDVREAVEVITLFEHLQAS